MHLQFHGRGLNRGHLDHWVCPASASPGTGLATLRSLHYRIEDTALAQKAGMLRIMVLLTSNWDLRL